MRDNKREIMRLKKYLCIGVLAFCLEFCSFLLLDTLIGAQLVVAQTVSFLVGLSTSYLGNRFVTFQETSHSALRAPLQVFSFLILGAVNLIVSNLLLHYLVEDLEVAASLAKIIVMVSITTWNYVIFSKIIFKKRS